MTQPEVISTAGLKLVAFAPEGLGVLVPAAPSTAETLFREHPEVILAADGPMFSLCPGEPPDPQYTRYRCGIVDYGLIDVARGVSVRSRYTGKGVTLSLVGGRLVGSRGWSPAAGASVAVQGYPGLVEAGRVAVGERPTGDNAVPNGRVAVGVLTDGRAFMAYARTDMRTFAERLAGAGAQWAAYTDGGGSSSLVLRRPTGELVGSDSDDPRGRRVPSWIVWAPAATSRQTVGPTGTRLVLPGASASTAVPWVLAAGVIFAAGAYWVRGRR